MPGKSQLTIDLTNAKQAFRRGWTTGENPRQYTPEEMEAWRQKRDALQLEQEEAQDARRAARVNTHTTAEMNRGIQAVQEATRHSETFFQAIGGAGSSNDLLLQGQAMIARSKQLKATEKAASAATAKAQKEETKWATKRVKDEERAAAAATKAAKKSLEAASKVAEKAKRNFEKATAKSGAKRQRTDPAASGHVVNSPESTEQMVWEGPIVVPETELIDTTDSTIVTTDEEDKGEENTVETAETAETAAENGEEQNAESAADCPGEGEKKSCLHEHHEDHHRIMGRCSEIYCGRCTR